MGCVIKNMGYSNCENLLKAGQRLLIVKLYDSTGARNYIDPAQVSGSTWLTDLLNDSDLSKRAYATPDIYNITTEKAEANFETMESGDKFFVSENARVFKGMVPDAPTSLKAGFESWRCACSDIGFYIVDIEGNLGGCIIGDDGYLYPIPFNARSIYAGVKFATDKTTQGVELTFDIFRKFDDSTIRMISADSFDAQLLQEAKALLDMVVTTSAPGQTSVTITPVVYQSDITSPIAVEGILAANVFNAKGGTAAKVRNITDSANITATVADNGDGTFTISYASQTASDSMSAVIKKNGYEFTTITWTA